VSGGSLRVGLAGLGRMGRPMAANLAAAGLLAGVYNRTARRADEFAAEYGVEAFRTPAELAEAVDVFVTMLADDAASAATYTGEAGFLEATRPSAVALEMGTVSVSHVKSLAEQLAAAGSRLLDAPVSGSIAMASDGTLTLMVGGDAETLDRLRPVFDALGSRVFHVGGVGAGAVMKLAVNTVVYGLNGALSEGLVLAERAGITRDQAYEVFAASAVAAPFVQYRRALFERPGEGPVGLSVRLAAKDLELILDLAEACTYAMPQAELNLDVLRRAMDDGFAEDDVSAVAQMLRGDSEVAAEVPGRDG
jgi:3-hydroxyisobutyrate dehydrogenase-like beta-hydroxyacid dehydrogenase